MKMTPQEKKRLSLSRDCRNTYGENDKSSRKAIRRRKSQVNRSFRRSASQVLSHTSDSDLDDQVAKVRRGDWKKSPDTPLGEMLRWNTNSDMETRLWRLGQAKGVLHEELAEFLSGRGISDGKFTIILRRASTIMADSHSCSLELDSADLEVLADFVDKHSKC